jgi:hypothetical protein
MNGEAFMIIVLSVSEGMQVSVIDAIKNKVKENILCNALF